MGFNPTFNNISVISWRSVLLVEETTDLPQVTDKLLSHNVVSGTPCNERGSNSQQNDKQLSTKTLQRKLKITQHESL
jgi:hypothetical protein